MAEVTQNTLRRTEAGRVVFSDVLSPGHRFKATDVDFLMHDGDANRFLIGEAKPVENAMTRGQWRALVGLMRRDVPPEFSALVVQGSDIQLWLGFDEIQYPGSWDEAVSLWESRGRR